MQNHVTELLFSDYSFLESLREEDLMKGFWTQKEISVVKSSILAACQTGIQGDEAEK